MPTEPTTLRAPLIPPSIVPPLQEAQPPSSIYSSGESTSSPDPTPSAPAKRPSRWLRQIQYSRLYSEPSLSPPSFAPETPGTAQRRGRGSTAEDIISRVAARNSAQVPSELQLLYQPDTIRTMARRYPMHDAKGKPIAYHGKNWKNWIDLPFLDQFLYLEMERRKAALGYNNVQDGQEGLIGNHRVRPADLAKDRTSHFRQYLAFIDEMENGKQLKEEDFWEAIRIKGMIYFMTFRGYASATIGNHAKSIRNYLKYMLKKNLSSLTEQQKNILSETQEWLRDTVENFNRLANIEQNEQMNMAAMRYRLEWLEVAELQWLYR